MNRAERDRASDWLPQGNHGMNFSGNDIFNSDEISAIPNKHVVGAVHKSQYPRGSGIDISCANGIGGKPKKHKHGLSNKKQSSLNSVALNHKGLASKGATASRSGSEQIKEQIPAKLWNKWKDGDEKRKGEEMRKQNDQKRRVSSAPQLRWRTSGSRSMHNAENSMEPRCHPTSSLCAASSFRASPSMSQKRQSILNKRSRQPGRKVEPSSFKKRGESEDGARDSHPASHASSRLTRSHRRTAPRSEEKQRGHTSETALIIDDSSSDDEESSKIFSLPGYILYGVGNRTRGYRCNVRWPQEIEAKTSLPAHGELDGGDGPFLTIDKESQQGEELGSLFIILLAEIIGISFDKAYCESKLVVFLQLQRDGSFSKRMARNYFGDEDNEIHDDEILNGVYVTILFDVEGGRKEMDVQEAEIRRRIPLPNNTLSSSSSSVATEVSEGNASSGNAAASLSNVIFSSYSKKQMDHIARITAVESSVIRRSTRSKRKHFSIGGAGRVFVQYPLEKTAADPIILTFGDYERLEQREFLNDNLVDWYLKFFHREGHFAALSPTSNVFIGHDDESNTALVVRELDNPNLYERMKDVHFFTAHFYKKLTGIDVSVNSSDEEDESVISLSLCSSSVRRKRCTGDDMRRSAHTEVARWTKDFDIFSKRFIFVPIVEHLHWSLAVIANLDCLDEWISWDTARKQTAAKDCAMVDLNDDSGDETDSNTLARKDNLETATSQQCVQDLDSSILEMLEVAHTDVNETYSSTKSHEKAHEVDVCADLSVESTSIPVLLTNDDADNRREPVPQTPNEPRRPCIIFMDSLNMHSASQVSNNLRHYIKNEWVAKKGTKKMKCSTSSKENRKTNEAHVCRQETELLKLPILRPKVPKQANCWDCGVYAAQYAEEIYVRWPNITDMDCNNHYIKLFSPEMFSVKDIKIKRNNMKKLLAGLRLKVAIE